MTLTKANWLWSWRCCTSFVASVHLDCAPLKHSVQAKTASIPTSLHDTVDHKLNTRACRTQHTPCAACRAIHCDKIDLLQLCFFCALSVQAMERCLLIISLFEYRSKYERCINELGIRPIKVQAGRGVVIRLEEGAQPEKVRAQDAEAEQSA